MAGGAACGSPREVARCQRAYASGEGRERRGGARGLPMSKPRRQPPAPKAAPTSASVPLVAGVSLGAFGVGASMIPVGSVAFGPTKAFVLAAAATAVAISVALDHRYRRTLLGAFGRSPLVWTAIALVIASCASTAFAVDPRRALLGGYPDYRGLLAVACFFVVGMGALVWRETNGRPAGIARAATVALLAIAVVAVGERFGLPPAAYKPPDAVRVISTLGNASNLGVWLLLASPLALITALEDPRRGWRWCGRASVVAGVCLLAWTLSRSAWAGALACVAVTGAIALRGERTSANRRRGARDASRARFAIGTAAAAVVLALAVASMPQVVTRVSALASGNVATLRWRLSTWRSSAEMFADRPLTGWGIDNFRFAYPRYQRPGQSDGRNGYLPTESAHNIVADAAAGSGLPGLLGLVALVAGCVWTALRRRPPIRGGPDLAETALVAGALSGALLALQFHYVTLDTGGALAALLGLVAAWGLPRDEALDPREQTSHARDATSGDSVLHGVVAWSVVVVLASASVFCALNLAAVFQAGRAVQTAARDAAWGKAAILASRARALAPWDPYVTASGGRAATSLLERRSDPGAAKDGLESYEDAQELARFDTGLAWERATLLLLSGLRSESKADLLSAAAEFERLESADPASGMPPAARARALLALSRAEEAEPLLVRAVELSPFYEPAWQDIATTYRLLGREQEAARAAAELERLRRK